MNLNLETPALLFPAISLLMLAYTNRFVTLANLIRNLHAEHGSNPPDSIRSQIANLRHRVILIRNMQAFGILAMLGCTVCMFVLFAGLQMAGKIIFGASILLLAISLTISFLEIQISVHALNLALSAMQPGKSEGSVKDDEPDSSG
jgi:hypothetical protein